MSAGASLTGLHDRAQIARPYSLSGETLNIQDEQNAQLRSRAERMVNGQTNGNRVNGEPKLTEDVADLLRQLVQQSHELHVHQIVLELQNEQLMQANLELERTRAEYAALFDGAPIGYLTLDGRGLIARANAMLAAQLGVERARLPGRRFATFVEPAGASSFALFLRRIFEPGEGVVGRTIELPLTGVGGATLYAQIEGVTVWNAGEAPECRLTVTDITPQRAAQEEVLRLNATLEERVERRTKHIRELSDELETFVYSVTHDLLTPLRHIRGFTQLMTRHFESQDAQQERYAQHVEHSVDRMEQLLRALLEFFRSGQQQVHLREVDLNRVVAEVRKDLAPELEGRELLFGGDSLPTVRGDSVALQAAFTNLLGNAYKFTRERTPARVNLRARETEREYVIGVEDNGAGFNMREKERLFNVFQRLHGEREFEGTGVGLALVRRIVRRHGGRVWAEGKPGEGATFWLALPKTHQEPD